MVCPTWSSPQPRSDFDVTGSPGSPHRRHAPPVRPPGLAGGRLCARSAAGRRAQGFRRFDRRAARAPAGVVPGGRAAWARISAWCWCADDGACVEVATFRSDRDYADGRRPAAVRFETDPRQDVLRRDFTINGLMLDPESGAVLDYVGGQADLRSRLVRAIGDPDVRFREDHLRLLRAIRFAARLGFQIETATFDAIQRNHRAILRVSAERVRDELTRILTEGGARRGFELLDATGLLGVLLPEVAAMKGVEQPPEYHPEGDVWVHTLLLLEKLGRPTATLAWGALLHDVGKPPTFRVADRIRFDGHVEEGVEIARGILSRLRFSREDMDRWRRWWPTTCASRTSQLMRESTLKRFLRLPRFDEHLELHRLDALSSNGWLENYEFVKRGARNCPQSA